MRAARGRLSSSVAIVLPLATPPSVLGSIEEDYPTGDSYSPFAARFVAFAPAFAVRFVFAAPAFHASFAAFGPPVKNPLTERPKVSTPSFAVRPPVLAPSLAAFLALGRFSSAAAGAAVPSASSAPRRNAALRLRRAIPLPHHLGRRGDLVRVGDEDRAARWLEALRPAWPPGAGRRRAHGVGGSAGTRG